MKCSIFVKTCRKDLEWLNYCLKSMRRHCSGFSGTTVAADEDCRGEIEGLLVDERLVFCPVHHNGYIQQQIIKLMAFNHTDSDLILFVDSDVVFTKAATPESFMIGEKPFLMRTPYGDLGGAEAWRGITSRFLGFSVQYEYMRRMPLAFLRSTLVRFYQAYHARISALNSMVTRDFSEFNALGAFAASAHPEKYEIINTLESALPESVATQYWSWGGISDEIRTEMEKAIT